MFCKVFRVFSRRRSGLPLAVCVLAVFFIAAAIGMLHLSQASAVSKTAGRELPVYSVDTPEKVVALTFNCAWTNDDIPALLKILQEEDIKATFFLVGQWAESYPDSVKQIRDAGHELGNHSYSHKDFAKISQEQMVQEIQKCSDAVEAVTGSRPELMRVPSGSYTTEAIRTVRECGMMPVQWDLDSVDWKNPTPEEMAKRILGKVQNGSIALFHSGAKNTPAALPAIIKGLKEKGYRFVTVGELIIRGEYTVDVQGRQHKAG